MNSGKYKVVKEIHVFDCTLGQIKIPKEKTVEIKEHGFVGVVEGNEFPGRLIDICESHLQRVYD